MSKAKHLRRADAPVAQRVRDAVLVERARCASVCESYAIAAAQRGLIVHPEIARSIAVAIRQEPA